MELREHPPWLQQLLSEVPKRKKIREPMETSERGGIPPWYNRVCEIIRAHGHVGEHLNGKDLSKTNKCGVCYLDSWEAKKLA